jgi:putative molybdopterin biosynthesis protein
MLNNPTPTQPTKVVPVIGVPGYPVSAALTGEIFIEPLMAQWLGRSPMQPQQIQAILTHKLTSPPGDDDYVRVVVGKVGDRTLAAPISRGAGVISSLSRADGITIIPRGIQGIEAGQPVQVRLYRSLQEIENTLLIIGSHDLTLDLLAKYLSKKRMRLSSSNTGSLGGLLAIQRGEAHLAGSHLLDTVTGEYNLSYIQQYVPDVPVRVIAWVNREQGLICPRGNPQNLKSLMDLTREEVTFVNRQRGAGTRILLDYEIGRLGLKAASIRGYQREEYTHLSVAAAVASGRTSCGLGIAAAARALNLDFISLYKERYDLVIPLYLMDNQLIKTVLDLAQDADFRKSVQDMPGYDMSVMGNIIL